jgi:SpoIID/LytB domain protein
MLEYSTCLKKEENSDAWKQAVSATSGTVLTSGGKPITAWFSSTHGGYVYSSGDIGWSSTSYTKNAKDTTTDSISSFSDLQNNAYDKASPWFYCDWGSRSQYGGTAWLKPEEVADILSQNLIGSQLIPDTTCSTVGYKIFKTLVCSDGYRTGLPLRPR